MVRSIPSVTNCQKGTFQKLSHFLNALRNLEDDELVGGKL